MIAALFFAACTAVLVACICRGAFDPRDDDTEGRDARRDAHLSLEQADVAALESAMAEDATHAETLAILDETHGIIRGFSV